jgi:hypothetical protein
LLEEAEGLPQGRPADAELLGQPFLDQAVTWSQLTRKHHVPHGVGGEPNEAGLLDAAIPGCHSTCVNEPRAIDKT